AACLELIDQNAHGDAGLASLAVGHVGDILAAAESALEQIVDKRQGLIVGEMRKELALEAAGQIGAGLRRGDVGLGEVRLLLAHAPKSSTQYRARIADPPRHSAHDK